MDMDDWSASMWVTEDCLGAGQGGVVASLGLHVFGCIVRGEGDWLSMSERAGAVSMCDDGDPVAKGAGAVGGARPPEFRGWRW